MKLLRLVIIFYSGLSALIMAYTLEDLERALISADAYVFPLFPNHLHFLGIIAKLINQPANTVF